jgi:plastocyanin
MTTTQGISKSFRWLAIAAASAAMALALVGLNSDFASAGATAQASGAKGVSIKGFAFHAAATHVAKGTKVTFTNKDGVTHNATGKGFKTGEISPGGSKSVTFKKKGTFTFHCSLHPEMHGKIIVG